MSFKIAFYALREFDELLFVKKISRMYDIDYVWTTEHVNEENIRMAEGCDAFSAPPCRVTEAMIDRFHEYGIKYFLCRCIGFDHLPVEYMKQYGMHISHVTYPPECVANYAIMLILMTTRKMNEAMIRANIQDFSLKGKMGRELGELTVGVIGTGNIGKTVIRHLAGFGCRILTCSRHQDEEISRLAEYVDQDTLFAQSDVITLHTALNPDTEHIINTESIAKMKDGVMIVNTARGGLIDTSALIAGLKSGKIGGAGLDVYENETSLFYLNRVSDVLENDEYNQLRSFPNVICSPHNAFYTETTVRNMIEKTFITADCLEHGRPDPFRVV